MFLKTLVGVILAAFLVTGCTPSPKTLIEETKRGVVFIVNERGADQSGIGTGFFIDENYIITNAHVVDKAETVKVAAHEYGDFYEAKVKFFDTKADLAVIQIVDWDKFIKENRITYLSFDTHFDVADEVYAIGHPWSLVWSASKGIISHPSRRISQDSPVFFVQTDAHVYQGNSGGVLIDTDGEVIGVNSMMLSREGGSYGFAIAAPVVQKVLRDFEKYGQPRWGRMGVVLEGTKIKEIVSGGPAEKAGLKVGDQILVVAAEGNVVSVRGVEDILNLLSVIDYEEPFVVQTDKGTVTVTLTYNAS